MDKITLVEQILFVILCNRLLLVISSQYSFYMPRILSCIFTDRLQAFTWTASTIFYTLQKTSIPIAIITIITIHICSDVNRIFSSIFIAMVNKYISIYITLQIHYIHINEGGKNLLYYYISKVYFSLILCNENDFRHLLMFDLCSNKSIL